MKTVVCPDIPKPNGHYSHAVIHNGIAYLSGILPNEVSKDAPLESQFEAVFSIIESILCSIGSRLSDVISCRIYLSDLELWPEVNALYEKKFGQHRAARVVVPVKELHFGYYLEVEVIAEIPEK